MPPSYIRVRAVVWAYGRGQTDRQTYTHSHTDTQTRVTTIHFASSTTHAKCNDDDSVDDSDEDGAITTGCSFASVHVDRRSVAARRRDAAEQTELGRAGGAVSRDGEGPSTTDDVQRQNHHDDDDDDEKADGRQDGQHDDHAARRRTDVRVGRRRGSAGTDGRRRHEMPPVVPCHVTHASVFTVHRDVARNFCLGSPSTGAYPRGYKWIYAPKIAKIRLTN